jgi:hypothetical protein
LKNFNEFGKVYAKKPLELDLESLAEEENIDTPFRFPEDERIRKRLGVQFYLFRDLLKVKTYGL